MRPLALLLLPLSGCVDVASLGAPCTRDGDCADGLVCAAFEDVRACASRDVVGAEGEGEGEGEPVPCAPRDVLLADATFGRARAATNGTVVAVAFAETTIAPSRTGSVSFRIEGIADGAVIDTDTIRSATDAVMVVDDLAWSERLQRFGLLFHEEPATDQHRGLQLAFFEPSGNITGVDEVFPATSTSVTAFLLPSPEGFVVVHEPRIGGDTFGVGVVAIDTVGASIQSIADNGGLFGTPVAASGGVFVAWGEAADPLSRVRVARVVNGAVTASDIVVNTEADLDAAQLIPAGDTLKLLHRFADATTSRLCALPGCATSTTVGLQLGDRGRPSVAVGRRGATLALTEDRPDSTTPASVVTLDLEDGTVVQRKRWSDSHASFAGNVAVLDGVALLAGSTDDSQPSRELRLVVLCDAEAW